MKALVVPVLALAVHALAACGGGGADCGNGVVDPGEQCDDGNQDETDFCRSCEAYLPPRTTVKWMFNANAATGFSQDGCGNLRVATVQVEMIGPDHVTLSDVCPNRQVVFDDLTPGVYQARVTPLDSGGTSLITAPAEMQVTAETTDTDQTIVIPPEAWIGPYTGTFFFTVRWGGMVCSTAVPPVDTQTVTLSVGGSVVTQATTTGEPLDGSAPVTCVPATNPSPIGALAVPFGPAVIEIVGTSAGVETFHGTFDTFVGAGPSNPTIDYDVQTVYDAGPPDA